MSGPGDWFRSADRLMMIAACVGAILVLGTSMAFSWPVTVRGDVPTAADERELAFDSPAGTCLFWTAPDGADMRRVDCAEPHLFEVTGNIDISAQFAEDAPPPELERWQELAVEKCTPSVTEYLGGTLDPHGRYKVNALKPSTVQWEDGDRKLRCGVQTASRSGALLPATGSAAGADQSGIHEPGTCLALDGQVIGDPVPCTEAHAVEIVGNVDLSKAFPDEYPSEEAQIEKAIELCDAVTKEYTNGVDLAKKGLIPYPDALKEESWVAGSRKVDCKVAAKLPNGSGLAPVTGSVRGIEQPTTTTKAAPTTTTGG
ncbi:MULTISPECIES: septum formation family protein [Actinokineospora]|uniref:septum formation family protein n=1 Tax=Actinokineospora TaxID=39845 RepID=UPI001670469A|nr:MULTISPECIES: septum formation family protein [Actinokineospora]